LSAESVIMRLDLYLKHTRLVKRRTVAKAAVEGGAVLVNGHPAKAGRDVKAGDVLTLTDGEGGNRRVAVVAEAIRPVPHGREAEFYRVLE
jgi:ribosomal 50S subunit-recycling heat shock protein